MTNEMEIHKSYAKAGCTRKEIQALLEIRYSTKLK